MESIRLDRTECQKLLEYINRFITKDRFIQEINTYFSINDVQKFLFSLCKDYDIDAERYLLQHKICYINENTGCKFILNHLDDDTYAISGETNNGRQIYTIARNYSEAYSYLQGLMDGLTSNEII